MVPSTIFGSDDEGDAAAAMPYAEVAGLIARFSACGMVGAVCYSASTAVILGAVGTTLGSNAQVAYGIAQSLLCIAYIGSFIGICSVLQVRTSRAIAIDPTGERAALVMLRGYLFTIPVTIVTCAAAAVVLAPLLIPVLWPGEVHQAHLHVGGGRKAAGVLPGAGTFDAEVRGMSATEQIVYTVWYSVPGCLVGAAAWTAEFSTLFEPETALVSNAVALAATYLAADAMVPHGLWAACLVPCVTFAVLWLGVVAMTNRRHPAWGRVLFSLGGARRPNLAPVLDARHLRNFAGVACRSALWQIGNVSNSELAIVVVGPALAHADLAAFNIIGSLLFVMWSVDEGILEGVGTVLSMQVGAATKGPRGGPWRVLLVGGLTSLVVTIAVAFAVGANAGAVASMFTREVDVAASFEAAMVPLVILRVLSSIHELWGAAVKTIERSEVASVSTLCGTAAVVVGGIWATHRFGPTVSVVLWWWVAVLAAQLCYATVVSCFIDWQQAFSDAADLAPTESDTDDDVDAMPYAASV